MYVLKFIFAVVSSETVYIFRGCSKIDVLKAFWNYIFSDRSKNNNPKAVYISGDRSECNL